jgi:hypothetical protein
MPQGGHPPIIRSTQEAIADVFGRNLVHFLGQDRLRHIHYFGGIINRTGDKPRETPVVIHYPISTAQEGGSGRFVRGSAVVARELFPRHPFWEIEYGNHLVHPHGVPAQQSDLSQRSRVLLALCSRRHDVGEQAKGAVSIFNGVICSSRSNLIQAMWTAFIRTGAVIPTSSGPANFNAVQRHWLHCNI